MATDQEESDADSAEAHAVFGLLAEVCGTGTVTMDDYEAVDDDVVTCREDTLADILKEVEDGTGDESEKEIDNGRPPEHPAIDYRGKPRSRRTPALLPERGLLGACVQPKQDECLLGEAVPRQAEADNLAQLFWES